MSAMLSPEGRGEVMPYPPPPRSPSRYRHRDQGMYRKAKRHWRGPSMLIAAVLPVRVLGLGRSRSGASAHPAASNPTRKPPRLHRLSRTTLPERRGSWERYYHPPSERP
jgi:hypothetical protein